MFGVVSIKNRPDNNCTKYQNISINIYWIINVFITAGLVAPFPPLNPLTRSNSIGRRGRTPLCSVGNCASKHRQSSEILTTGGYISGEGKHPAVLCHPDYIGLANTRSLSIKFAFHCCGSFWKVVGKQNRGAVTKI